MVEVLAVFDYNGRKRDLYDYIVLINRKKEEVRMKRRSILRFLSCCLAGVLLVEAPMQVSAAPLDPSAGQVTPAEGNEDGSGTEILDEGTTETTEPQQDSGENEQVTSESEEASEKKDTGDGSGTGQEITEPDPDIPSEDPAKTEGGGQEDIKEENNPSSVPEEADKKEEEPSGPAEDPGAVSTEDPADSSDEPSDPSEEVPAELQTGYLTLTGVQYGSRPEYSEDFDAETADALLSGLTEALVEDQADVSEYAISPETLADALTWIVSHEEAYDTLLPYVEYTYIEKEDAQEVQTVTVSRLPEEKLLSLSAVRDAEDVKISFVPGDGIEQYRVFRISGDEVTELSREEGQDVFIDRTVFEQQSSCQYVICGYQTVEEELKLCAFSRCVSGEYELAPPENLETEPGEGSITLTWEAVELASGYEIETSDQEDGEFTAVGQVEGTEYIQDQLEDGEEHFYRVRAYSDVDEEIVYSDVSQVASGVTLPTSPELSYTVKDNVVTFKWNKVNGADGYILYEYKENNYVPVTKTTLSCENYSYPVSDLKLGEKHQYVVAAFVGLEGADEKYSADKMTLSNVVDVEITFDAVTLKCSASSYKGITLTWSKSVWAQGYRLERKVNNGGYTAIAELPSGTLTYTDKNVEVNKKYTYKVIPWQKDSGGTKGDGKESNEISVTPVFPAVKSASVAKVDYRTLKIAWSKVTDATGYEVYRSTSKTGTYTRVAKITSGSTFSCQDSKCEPGVTYYYKVRAYLTSGSTIYGDYSPIVSGATALNKVSGVKAVSAAYNEVKLTWSKVSGATGYVIERSENGSSYNGIKTITSGSTLTYTNLSLSFNKKYSYRIRAYYKRSDGKNTYSSYSSAVSVTTKLPAAKISSVASVNYNTVKVSWGKVTGAGGYKVYRATSSNGTYSTVATIKSGSTVSCQNTGLTMDKTYYYKVRPYRIVSGKEIYGDYSAAVKGVPKLSAVTKAKAASASYNAIKVSWAKTAGASGYVVYYSTSKNSGYKTLKTVTGTSVTHSGLTTGKIYYYKIRAYRTVSGKKVYGGYSSVVSAKPVPGTVAAKRSTVTYNSVKLTWAKISGASGYEVYRSGSKNGTYSRVTTLTSGNTLSYNNINLTTGKTYYYKVRAYRIINGKKIYGSFSAVLSGKPTLKTPTLKRSTMTYNSAKLTWNKIAGANGYEIYRSTSKNGTYEHIKRMTSGSSVAYTDSSLATGRTYYYKIRAYRTVSGKRVYGAFSSLVSAKPVLGKVSGLKAIPTGDDKGNIKLTWSKVTGATGYVISRATSKDGTYKTVKTIDSGGTVSWTNTGLVLGQKYYYKICATRGSYKSGVTGPAQAMASIMELSDSSLSLTVGNSQKIAVVTLPKVTVSWSTSDKKVATVDSNGKVTATGAGTAKIYAKANGLTKTIKVTVEGKNTGSGNYKGIDVSSYQGSINWKKVADDGIDFAMIRVTVGKDPRSTEKDSMFESNYNGARDNGVKVGLYRYSYAGSRTEARCEAEAIVKYLNGRKLDYPIVMDVEDDSILRSTNTNTRRSEIVLAFKEVIEDAGYDFALYANTTWLNNYLDMNMLKNVDIWVARWRSLDQGHGYNGKGNVTMWQYSNSGSVSGISGRVDMNVSYKNY